MNKFKLYVAVATSLWGFTYIVSSTMLPANPWFVGAVRAGLGAIPLLIVARELPPRGFWPKLIVLGTLNTGLFFGLLFVAAFRLPGGIAGIFQALGPLFSILLVWPLLTHSPTRMKIFSLLVGLLGVVLVILKGGASLDLLGVLAALGSAFSVALGGVLAQKWGHPMSISGFTAWQLIIAAIELTVITLVLGDFPAELTAVNGIGLLIVALVLTSLPFYLWFKGIQGEGAANVAPFFLLSPIVAFVLDGSIKGVMPTSMQLAGVALVICGLILNIYAGRRITTKAPVQQVRQQEQTVVE